MSSKRSAYSATLAMKIFSSIDTQFKFKIILLQYLLREI